MADATVCFSGFSREDLAAVQQQFEQANAATGNRWSLANEAEAQVLVIDMDSMYGHMTWLKAHGSGKTTVGLTAGERSETDFLLRRPVTVDSLSSLLGQIGQGATGATEATAPPDPSRPEPVPRPETPETEAPSAAAPAAEVQTASAPAAGPAAAVEQPAPAAAPASTAVPAAPPESPRSNDPSADYRAAVTTGQMAAMPALAAAHRPGISDFLAPGALSGLVRLQLPGAPALVLDPATQTYAGSATLKPLSAYVEAELGRQDFVAIEPGEFEQVKAAGGGVQPYMRLLWMCGLTLGHGQLLPGFNPAKKFVLTKWPQIEREYPKHFRLATVMMKGPALIKDLIELSGVAANEVADFINAGLVAGSIIVEGSAPAGGDPARASALLARPRAG